jgi:two-component system, LytTR family, sensor histidine kinase AlgZ
MAEDNQINPTTMRFPAEALRLPKPLAGPRLFGQSWRERLGARLLLILAATLVAMLLEGWLGRPCINPFYGTFHPHSLSVAFFHTLSYSLCISLVLLHAFAWLSDRISHLRFPLNWVALFLTILVSSALGCALGGALIIVLGIHAHGDYFRLVSNSLYFSLILSLVFGTSFFLYENLKQQLEATALELRTRQLAEERARKLAIAMQLASLESRVRPHFLFNTLNSIASLIREDQECAEQMVGRLSALLRFSLDANHHNSVPLRDELKIVRDYLEIEKARFGARLQFELDVPTELGTVAVPPFALQTLVENSVKYCIAPQRTGGSIHVSGRQENQIVKLEVRDDGPGFSEAAISAGHGLDNLQARLNALFAERAALEIQTAAGFTSVTLTLPYSPNSLPAHA